MSASRAAAVGRGAAPCASIALSVVLCIGTAVAPTPSRAQKAGTTARPGALLTPDQLRACLSRRDGLRARADEVLKQQSTLAENKAEIDRLGKSLEDRLAALDRSSADAVAAYTAEVASRDKLIDGYEQAVPAFNSKVEALKADQAAYASACENRRYDEADEIRMRKGG